MIRYTPNAIYLPSKSRRGRKSTVAGQALDVLAHLDAEEDMVAQRQLGHAMIQKRTKKVTIIRRQSMNAYIVRCRTRQDGTITRQALSIPV